jgi:hypothetical protein
MVHLAADSDALLAVAVWTWDHAWVYPYIAMILSSWGYISYYCALPFCPKTCTISVRRKCK